LLRKKLVDLPSLLDVTADGCPDGSEHCITWLAATSNLTRIATDISGKLLAARVTSPGNLFRTSPRRHAAACEFDRGEKFPTFILALVSFSISGYGRIGDLVVAFHSLLDERYTFVRRHYSVHATTARWQR
jgi:hypothetical protein